MTSTNSMRDSSNFSSDASIFEENFLAGLYARAEEITINNLPILKPKENVSIDLLLRDLLQSQLSNGTLAYPVQIQNIFSTSINQYLSNFNENISLYPYIEAFSMLDKSITKYIQSTLSLPSKEEKKNEDQTTDNLDSDLPMESLADMLCLSFGKNLNLAQMPISVVDSFLSSFQNSFDKTEDRHKLKLSKISTLAIQKVLFDIFENSNLITPAILSKCAAISFAISDLHNSFFDLVPYLTALWKYQSDDNQLIDFIINNYFRRVFDYTSKSIIPFQLFKNENISKIANIFFVNVNLIYVVTDDGKLFSIDRGLSKMTCIEKIKIENPKYALIEQYLLEEINDTNEYLLYPLKNPEQVKKLMVDFPTQNLFLAGSAENVFYLVSTDDFQQFKYLTIKDDSTVSDICEFSIPYPNNKKLYKVQITDINNITLYFEDSPFEIKFSPTSKQCTQANSRLNQHSLSSSFTTYNATVIEPNEIIVGENDSSFIFHIENYKGDANTEKFPIKEHKKKISDFFSHFLKGLLNKIFDIELNNLQSDDNEMMKFFTESAQSTIEHLLPLCLSLDIKNDLFSLFLLTITICLYLMKYSIPDELKNSIYELFEKLLKSDYVLEYPELQNYIIISMTLSSKYLFENNETKIQELFELIVSHPEKKKNFIRSGLLNTMIHFTIILYLSENQFVELVLHHLPMNVFFGQISHIINNIYLEGLANRDSANILLQGFMKVFIPTLVDLVLQESQIMGDNFKPLLYLSFRMNALHESILPFYFAEIVAPFLHPLQDHFISIKEYQFAEQRPEEQQFTPVSGELQYVFSSPSNSSTDKAEYYFPGAYKIEATLTTNRRPCYNSPDIFYQYVSFDGDQVYEPAKAKFTIPSDRVTVIYRSQESYRSHTTVKLSAQIIKNSTPFHPNNYQFIFSYLVHIIGQTLGFGLTSLPITQKEEECKVLLQSNILQHTTTEQIPMNYDDKHQSKPTQSRRSIGRGLSFNFSQLSMHPPDLLESFLRDINSEYPKEDGPAQLLLNHLNTMVKYKFHTTIGPEISSVEKASFAVMLKHLGAASEAYTYATILRSNNTQPVPPTLHKIWQAIHKIRRSLISVRQNCAQHNIDLNDPENEFNIKTKDCLQKCNFLLNNEPILRVLINELKDGYDSTQTMEKAIGELVSFILSSVRFSEISALVELRKERFWIRLRAIDSIQNVLKGFQEDLPGAMFVLPLIPTLNQALKSGDTISLPVSMINTLNEKVADLSEFLIDSFIETSNFLKSAYAQILTVPFISTFNPIRATQVIKKLIDFHQKLRESNQSLFQSISLFLAQTSLCAKENFLALSESFINNYTSCSDELINFYLLLIATTIQLHKEYRFDGFTTLMKILSRSENTPQIFSAALYPIGQLLCSENSINCPKEFVFEYENQSMNFEQFITFILKNIGSIYLNNTTDFCKTTNKIRDCIFYLADEMISFVRILASPISQVHQAVNNVLHDSLKTLSSKKETEAIGCFLVLGFGIHSLKYSPNAFFSGQINTKRAIVTQYLPKASKMTYNQNGKSLTISTEVAKPYAQPYANIPSSFLLTKNECKDIANILNNVDNSIFTSIVASYLPVAVQIKENADNLLEFINLDSLFKLSLANTDDPIYTSLNDLCDNILAKNNQFQLPSSLAGDSQNSVQSRKATSYRITVDSPKSDFLFGFFSDGAFDPNEEIIRNKQQVISNDTQSNTKPGRKRQKKRKSKEKEKEVTESSLYSLSRYHYYLVSPMTNRFINKDTMHYFPLLPIDRAKVQSGDIFECSLYNNVIYFTFCRTNQVYCLKTEDKVFLPFIQPMQSKLIIEDIDPLTAPPANAKNIIDLGIARYSVKNAKKQEKARKLSNFKQQNQVDNVQPTEITGFGDIFDELYSPNSPNPNANADNTNNNTEVHHSDNTNSNTEVHHSDNTNNTEVHHSDNINNADNINNITDARSNRGGFALEIDYNYDDSGYDNDDNDDNDDNNNNQATNNAVESNESNDPQTNTTEERPNDSISRLIEAFRRMNHSQGDPFGNYLETMRETQPTTNEPRKNSKKKRSKKQFPVNTSPIPFNQPLFNDTIVLLNSNCITVNQRKKMDFQTNLQPYFNKYGVLNSVETMSETTFAYVEFTNKTTGLIDTIRVETESLNLIQPPSFPETLKSCIESSQKEFIIRMLRYTTFLAIKSKFYSHIIANDQGSLIKYSNQKEFINFIAYLILDLISTKYTSDSYDSFKEKVLESAGRATSKLLNQTINTNLIIPGDTKELSKELIEFILVISKAIPDFFNNLLSVVINKWPSPTFDDFAQFASPAASFNFPFITEKTYLNMTYSNLASRGYLFIFSPNSCLQKVNALTIDGCPDYHQEFTNFDTASVLNGFSTSTKISLTLKGHSNRKDKLNFLLVPLSKHFINDKSPASYIHLFSVLINFAFAFLHIKKLEFKETDKLNDLFITNIIPLLITKSIQNDTFTMLIFYHFLTVILQQINFRQHRLDFNLLKRFDVLCQQAISSTDNKFLSLSKQKIILLKILLRKSLYPLPYADLPQTSMMISRKSCNKAIVQSNLQKQVDALDSIARCENEPSFLSRDLQAYELCYSLSSSSYFPHYLIFDYFLSSYLPKVEFSSKLNGFYYLYTNLQVKTVDISAKVHVDDSNLLSRIEFHVIDPDTSKQLESFSSTSHLTIGSNHFAIVAHNQHLDNPDSLKDVTVEITIQAKTLSDKGKFEIYMEHFDEYQKIINTFETAWSSRVDESIMRLISQDNWKLPNDYQVMCPILAKFDEKILNIRIHLMRLLNNEIDYLFSSININNIHLPLSQILIKASPAILLNIKQEKIWAQLPENKHQLSVVFNRSKAALAINNSSDPRGVLLIDQLMNQIPMDRLSHLNQTNRPPWHVNLEGEGASDAGGPGRELFTSICTEIIDVRAGLFTVTPNRRREQGPNQDVLIPNVKIIYKSPSNPSDSESESSTASSNIDDHRLSHYFYIGVLMGAAFPSKLPQPFFFANFIWSYLIGREVSIEDIYEIDEEFHHTMTSIKTCEPSAPFSQIYNHNFTLTNSFGETVELIQGGTYKNVDYDNRLEYCRLCEEYRCHEFDLPLKMMRAGLTLILTDSLLRLLTPWEIKMLLCGDTDIPVNELRKRCYVQAGSNEDVDMLFKILERFTSSERMLFIKFTTGRMSLPPPGLNWSSPLNIRFQHFPRPDSQLPHAATCSNSITIPIYSSEEIFERMLRIAIIYGADIDQDNEPNLTEAVNLA